MFPTDRHSRRPGDWSALSRLTVLAAAAALIVVAHVTMASAGVGVNSAKLAGAFVNWGPVGREHTLQAWEKWLKQEPSSVLGLDFYGQATWEDFYKFNWVPGIWKNLNPGRNVVWSMPLAITGTRLADVGNGLHDGD